MRPKSDLSLSFNLQPIYWYIYDPISTMDLRSFPKILSSKVRRVAQFLACDMIFGKNLWKYITFVTGTLMSFALITFAASSKFSSGFPILFVTPPSLWYCFWRGFVKKLLFWQFSLCLFTFWHSQLLLRSDHKRIQMVACPQTMQFTTISTLWLQT